MDFVTALPKMRNDNDTIRVIVDRLIEEIWNKKQLAKTYIKRIVS